GQNGGQNGNPNGNGAVGQGGGQQYRNDRQGDVRDRPDRGDRPTDRPPVDRQNDRQDRGDRRSDFSRDFREDRDPGSAEQPRVVDVIDLGAEDATGLIETPESLSHTRAEPAAAIAERPASDQQGAPRRARSPRKPKAEGKPDGDPPQEAAE
ncbi:MAG: hypothetical protein NTW20_14620, partial [Rhodobacterales bacterium]|nr:hypothetical protein [Rhodobacterales bacterium]